MIYVQRVDLDNKFLRTFDIFSPQGHFLYTGEMKVAKDLTINTLTFKHNLLILALEDEDGEISVAKYTIKLPPARPS
jgi:hypothetical protein